MPLSSFSVDHLLVDVKPTLRVFFSSETSLEETKFSFASGYQLERAAELGMEACMHFCFSSRTPSGADVCRSCECCLSLWVPMCVDSYWLSASCFFGFPHFPWFFSHTFCLLFHRVSGALKGRIWWRCLIRAECPRTSCSWQIVCLWVPVCSHLLKEEASLMVAEQGTDLWVQQNVIRTHFIDTFF